MFEYGRLVAAIIFLAATIISGIRWFVIRKDYSVSSILLVAVYFLAFVVFVLQFICHTDKVNMDFVTEAEACFVYEDADVLQPLSAEELQSVKAIFDGKKMYKDNPSCGFSEDISIIFDKSQTFCLARDNCAIVYWQEEDKYIKLSEDEKAQLHDLLESYGFVFPCV
ncbi:MAG: hypothetical protein E7267_02970 [Lachnospiraceae bacterium]|nr:hypothetical protein [Lachnospiraceae bacterium]